MRIVPNLPVLLAVFVIPLATPAQQVALPAGTALRIELDRAARVRPGSTLTGHLTEPLFLADHEIVPAGALVKGVVEGTRPGPRTERVQRLLAADFTPPRIPSLTFQHILVPAQAGRPALTLAIDAPGEITNATVLTLGTRRQKQSIRQRIGAAIAQNKAEAREALRKPHLKEVVERWALGQLPYHPDILWSKTHFNADLRTPASIVDVPHPAVPLQDLAGRLPEAPLHARLLSALSSATAKYGDAVDAVVAQPLFSADRSQLVVPEGTHLYGVVAQAKPARSFGRNGSLRFYFNKLDLPTASGGRQVLQVHGRLAAAETAPDQHTALDEEGQVKASDGPAKIAEPAVLFVLASAATPDDHDTGGANLGTSTVASNGFGLIARIASLTTRNRSVVEGFAYYSLAKSIYFHFLDKGHETTFGHDTELEVTLSAR